MAGDVQIDYRVHGALFLVGHRFRFAASRALVEVGQAPSIVLVAYPAGVF